MITLGIIGGIGSGKSAVAALFGQLGAGVIDADALGHRVLRFPEVRDEIRKRWGDAVFDTDGELNRYEIAKRVFAATESGRRELEFLTLLTHPRIKHEIDTELRRLRENGATVAVLDAALLLETDWKTSVDRIVFVDTPRSIRLQRVRQRGWTEAQFDAREAAQLPLEAKKKQADWVVDNSRFLPETLDIIREIWQNSING